ncbi:ENDD1 protein, partial [Neodrepanis coruscans]|nr:ENDD1 protein [Neodrepanis coruscans]
LLMLQVWAGCLWLGHSEVVQSFEESCPKFFYQETPPNNALKPQDSALICQHYNGQPFFATLYDKSKRIPVYSAYIYQPGNTPIQRRWLVEPQLISENLPNDMKTEKTLIKQYLVSPQLISDSQAISQDYNNLKDWDRGHLNPKGHQSSKDGRLATFTLTNVVPQNTTLNHGAWLNYEQQTMMQESRDCKTTYVITGAVPGNMHISGGRVTVPSHIWSSACCKTTSNQMKAWAVIAENDKNEVEILELGKLEETLAKLHGKGQVSLFHKDCPRY